MGMIILAHSEANILNTGSYDSGWKGCGGCERVRVAVYADQDLDYYLQFSHDGVNPDADSRNTTADRITSPANLGRGDDFATFGYYARLIVENNSGVDTTTCRIRLYGFRP